MRWFGQVNDADEQWTMDAEKVVCQVSLGILRQHKVGFNEFLFLPPSILVLIQTCFLQSDPISKDEFMTKWNTAIGDTFSSSTSLELLMLNTILSFGFGALYNGRK